MELLEGLDGLRAVPAGSIMSIGNFDGVHLGHQRILALAGRLRDEESRKHPTSSHPVVVVTFEPHPLTVLRPEAAPPRLTSPAMKRQFLAAAGVDYLVVLPPSPQVLNMMAEAFWELLRDQVRPAHLIEGMTFTFGKCAKGNTELLRQWSSGTGIQLHVVEPVSIPLLDLQVAPVSSSLIRWLLDNGRVRDAAICLGRPFTLEGPVIRGYGRGRGLGIPTANVQPGDQMVPMDGVYAGRCTVDGRVWPVAASIGTMPTFGENRRQIEAHLIGFDGDLYDRTLRVEFIDWLREQRKFPDVSALKAQMARDLAAAAERSNLSPARPIANLA